MSSIVEVELRGPLSEQQINTLKAFLVQNGESKGIKNRYMVHFEPEETKKDGIDVRARITNGACELMVKKGDMGSGVRTEYPASCTEGQFIPLCKALVAMGFASGVGCHRVSDRYQIDAMEFAIIHVPGHSTFYEAEFEVPENEIESAKEKLSSWLTEQNLSIFSKEEFDAYVAILDREANDQLDFQDPESWKIIEKRLTI